MSIVSIAGKPVPLRESDVAMLHECAHGRASLNRILSYQSDSGYV